MGLGRAQPQDSVVAAAGLHLKAAVRAVGLGDCDGPTADIERRTPPIHKAASFSSGILRHDGNRFFIAA
jgi:hypothetical protein